ncbi:hypothetical protein E0Z10_g7530 [Xylaria hypoxylon]|uniref:Uncharacterized protein n=1 Tax=Xylaria hypoxylon TaxID=37992 RepID=A0A4Z0YDP7_9PEZI|nr:hypothetical protein E0Z10_g7530 [Xylaria hypoxylon]
MFGIGIKVLYLPGFAFERTSLFSDEKLATRFYAAVIGPIDDVNLEDLRSGVEGRLKAIFRICLRHWEFYTTVSGSDIFWRLASEQWDTLDHVDPDEVAAFVEICQAARENCDPGVLTGELSDTVDVFIHMRKKVLAQSPARHFQVTLSSSTISQATLGSTSLATSSSILTAVIPWPPFHFTEQELAWLSHGHIWSQIYGLTPCMNITKAAHIPRIPDAYAHPLDVRLFLAFTGLVSLHEDRRTSLCMAPITFWDDEERRDWYLATGGASKLCWTTWEFCKWAKEEFNRGREAVVGLCHFHCIAQEDPWKCAGVLIRKLEEGSYEFIMEDAHYHRVSANPEYYEEKYDIYPNSGMDFKSALLQDVESHFNVTSFWHGGEVPNAFANFGICPTDSVSTSCSFVVLAVQEKIPIWDLDEEEWSFSREIPEKMRYWESQIEKREYDMKYEMEYKMEEEEEEGELHGELKDYDDDDESEYELGEGSEDDD